MSRLPLIVGHRGASALAPENTLAAFRRAMSDSADGIEFDVRLSHDGVCVVIHDDTLERTGLIRRKVSTLTAAELQATDVGAWFHKRGSRRAPDSSREPLDETVPLLEDVFDLFAQRGLLYLEMKADRNGRSELVAEVVRMIQQTPVRERVIVECFDLALIQQVKTIDARIRTAALFEPKIRQPARLLRRDFPQLAADVGADEIALHHALASPRVIEQALHLKQPVVVWTVDDPTWVAKARELEITALITNNPALLLSARNSPVV